MSDNESKHHGGALFFIGLVIAALVGLVIGLLIAPHSGPVMRRKILRTAGEAKDQMSEVLDDLEESGKEFLSDVKRVKKV